MHNGNATNCNGISFWNMADWAKELNKVEWCAELPDIFLSACITGCKDPIFEGPGIRNRYQTIPHDPKVRTSTICGVKGYATERMLQATLR